MNYYSHHIGDYRRDTAHLSLLEHGVYRQLLDMYYLSETRIPEETEVVYRRLCAKTDDEKKSIDVVLSEFFIYENGWVHKRCEREILEYKMKVNRARSNGKLGGRPSKTKVVISGNKEETQEKANHKPLTINHKPLLSDSDTPRKKKSVHEKLELTHEIKAEIAKVGEQILKDWEALRKARRAPITRTVWVGMVRESKAAGITLQESLAACCEYGWQSFKAEWWKNKQRGLNNGGHEARNGFLQPIDTRSRAKRVSDRLDEIGREALARARSMGDGDSKADAGEIFTPLDFGDR